MAAYGSTTSIMMENVKHLKKEVILLTEERDALLKEVKILRKNNVVAANTATVGPNPNRKRESIKSNKKK